MDASNDTPEDTIEDVERRALDGATRCIRPLLIALDRDFETCGKASCKRSRRCRGFACEPETTEEF